MATVLADQADANLKAGVIILQLRVRFIGYDYGARLSMRVLLIEDDPVLGSAVRDHVSSLGSGVDWVQRIDDARASLATVPYELILLDLNLPDGRGLDLLRSLRRQASVVPVIILTAQDQIAWRIEGLNSGADDYLVKPFDLSELSARIAAVARRYARNPNPLLRLGDVEIDLARRLVSVRSKPVDLTAREWAVLARLGRHPNAMVAKADIEESLYEFGAEIDSNAVEVYISRLRKKLGRDTITTIRGAGYKVTT
jgi:two-component system, OmpR family, response regulator